jgi:hypothetical protein
MTEPQPATIVLSAAEFQAIVDEMRSIGAGPTDQLAPDVVRVGPFELSRSEFQTMAAAVAVRPTPIDSVQLTLADDGGYRATWINATDPPTVSTLLIRPGD